MSLVLFGLTGGIASGKSTVAARFRGRGLDVIDADQVARDVVAPQTDGLRAVVDAFGATVLCADGSLDREQLGTIVFGDADQRARLNAIVHPRIGIETQRRAQALEQQGVALACYEAALLVENGLADAFRPLVVVSLEPEVQRRRVMDRDGLGAGDAEQRVDAQLPLADKVAIADHVIDNSGNLEQLMVRADDVLDAIREQLVRG